MTSKSLTAILFVLVIVASIIYGGFYLSSKRDITNCVVDSKDRSVSFSSDDKGNFSSSTNHRVYTSCGVFTVSDNIFFLRFNSADTYGMLQEGKTYDFTVVGWRNGFFSWFPNILEATPKA